MRDPKGTASMLTMMFTGLAELVLGVRAVFLLLDADRTNSFVGWIYAMSEPLLNPIRSVIEETQFAQRFILDFRTLLAMSFWAVIGYVVLAILEGVRKPKLETDSGWRRWLRSRI